MRISRPIIARSAGFQNGPSRGGGRRMDLGGCAIARQRNSRISAFTLMEVMIAIGVFCIGVFAILGLVAQVMRGARLLDKPMVDAGPVASQIAGTNSLVEIQGVSGDLSEFLGDRYKGYDYVYGIEEVESNHLYKVEIYVTSDTPGKPVISKMNIRLFRPQSPPGSLDFGGQTH
ncbi:MAG: type IV pilus modification PilV family protein [Limisphaerales bacterium]